MLLHYITEFLEMHDTRNLQAHRDLVQDEQKRMMHGIILISLLVGSNVCVKAKDRCNENIYRKAWRYGKVQIRGYETFQRC